MHVALAVKSVYA